MVVTIRDVARRAGVSVTTASRVLNHRLDTSPLARERVWAAARELDYTVNLHARALTGATSRTIGLIVLDSSSVFHATMVRAVEETITPFGYSVIVCNTDNQPDKELKAHRTLLEKRVDGVLINSVLNGVAPLQRLLSEGIPFVLVNRSLPDEIIDHVRVDIRRGTYLATSHLLQLGHRCILHHTGGIDHSPSHDRVEGYRQALEEFGVPFDPTLVLHYHKDPVSGVRVIRDAIAGHKPRPTAVVAFDDVWAMVVYKACSELGLRIPDDVAVTGHMDLPFAPILIPPLTTVVQRVADSGRLAAQILLEKLSCHNGQQWTPQRITLEPELVVRESSGAPVASGAVSG